MLAAGPSLYCSKLVTSKHPAHPPYKSGTRLFFVRHAHHRPETRSRAQRRSPIRPLYEACCTLPEPSLSQLHLRITLSARWSDVLLLLEGRRSRPLSLASVPRLCFLEFPSGGARKFVSRPPQPKPASQPALQISLIHSLSLHHLAAHAADAGYQSVREEASSLGLGFSISKQHRHPPATGPATAILFDSSSPLSGRLPARETASLPISAKTST